MFHTNGITFNWISSTRFFLGNPEIFHAKIFIIKSRGKRKQEKSNSISIKVCKLTSRFVTTCDWKASLKPLEKLIRLVNIKNRLYLKMFQSILKQRTNKKNLSEKKKNWRVRKYLKTLVISQSVLILTYSSAVFITECSSFEQHSSVSEKPKSLLGRRRQYICERFCIMRQLFLVCRRNWLPSTEVPASTCFQSSIGSLWYYRSHVVFAVSA